MLILQYYNAKHRLENTFMYLALRMDIYHKMFCNTFFIQFIGGWEGKRNGVGTGGGRDRKEGEGLTEEQNLK